MSLLEVKNITHIYGDKLLFKDSSFELNKHEHMGLVGQNGAGKSTLMNMLIGEVIPDQGSIKWGPKIKIGNIDQYAKSGGEISVFDFLKTAYKELFDLEIELEAIYKTLTKKQDQSLIKRAAAYQEKLENQNFYAIKNNIYRVSAGLGITAIGMDRKLSELSGGQRAKIILAKLLLEKPNVLLLDEPTNFLDKEHIEWLCEYLVGFKGAFIIISHDFSFIDKISNCICDIEFDTIKKYSGNYTSFLAQKGQKREEYVRQYEKQQKFIKVTTDYISKNKARASSAKMAKDRQKKLDKIEKITAPTFTSKPSIHFNKLPLSSQYVLNVTNLDIGYYYPILKDLSFDIRNDEKAVITGFNGIGKSTLLKTLIGEIKPISGKFKFCDNIVIGYFAQDLKWENEDDTPFKYISSKYPNLPSKLVRKSLSQCGLKTDMMDQTIKTLSGGEQAKIKICNLSLSPCNILILDEPTNHLDAEAKDSLKNAICEFSGTVILVSHESQFYKSFADSVISIENYVK